MTAIGNDVRTWGPRSAGPKPHHPHKRDVVQDRFGMVYAGFKSAREVGSVYALFRIASRKTGEVLMDAPLHAKVLRAADEAEVKAAMKGRSVPGYRIARGLMWYEIHAD